MSSHPYGLRGDPFASPATLSAKDASRLIRRRVRAFNGDGGVLFPIDTCDLIHESAGGVPDAMLALAGRAMRIAADAGAPAVLPAHVRQATASVPANAPRAEEAVIAATPDAAPAHDEDGEDDIAREPEDEAATDDVFRTRSEIPTRAQISARAQAVLAWEETPAVADDDPDLPAFHPAPFALPSEPSEALDPDSRDWVSRFIVPAPGVAQRQAESLHVPRAAAEGASARKRRANPAQASTPSPSSSAFAPSPVPTADVESALAVAYGHAAPRRRSRSRPQRRRRRSGGQGLLIAIAALCAVAFIVRMSMRGNLLPPGNQPERPLQTSAPAVEPSTSVPEAPSATPSSRAPAEQEPASVVPPSTAIVEEPLIGGRSLAQQLSTSPSLTTPATAPESVVPVRHEVSHGKFGLEVATFIFEERARVERDRLAANGLKARLVTTVEYGSRVYRVVVGGFPHPAAAERAADSLLSNGLVLQARVIRNP